MRVFPGIGWISAMIVAFAGLFSTVATRAQQQATEIPPPTIRVSTRMVLVDVVVRDKRGNPVSGLKPDDFVIEEDGKKQKIATFLAPSTGSTATAPPTLAAGLYTNRPDFRSPGGAPIVIVLDAANALFRDQAYARLQMLKFVAQQSSASNRIAVFTLTDGLQLLQDFTTDPRVLQDALQHYRPQEQTMAPACSTG